MKSAGSAGGFRFVGTDAADTGYEMKRQGHTEIISAADTGYFLKNARPG